MGRLHFDVSWTTGAAFWNLTALHMFAIFVFSVAPAIPSKIGHEGHEETLIVPSISLAVVSHPVSRHEGFI